MALGAKEEEEGGKNQKRNWAKGEAMSEIGSLCEYVCACVRA